jgi:cation transport ATPase
MKLQEYYIWSNNIGCSGCAEMIKKPILALDENATIETYHIAKGEMKIGILSTKKNFKDEFNKKYEGVWRLCTDISEYSQSNENIHKSALYEATLLLLAALAIFSISYFLPYLRLYFSMSSLIISSSLIYVGLISYYTYNNKIGMAFNDLVEGRFRHSSLVLLLVVFLLLSVVSSSFMAVLQGATLCLDHFYCPIILLASLSIRDLFSITLNVGAGIKADNNSSLEYNILKAKDAVDISSIKEGDTVIIHPGQVVPCDGKKISGDNSFDTQATTGDTFTNDDVSNVQFGWVYLPENRGDLVVEATAVKGSVKFNEVRAKFFALLSSRSSRVDDKSGLVSLSFSLVSIIVPLLRFVFDPSVSLMSAVNMLLILFMIACPCSLIMAQPYIRREVVNNLHTRFDDFGLKVHDMSVLQRLSASNIVFCWDRTNTLTNPDSPHANGIRDEVKGVLKELRDMGCEEHYVLSGNPGKNNERVALRAYFDDDKINFERNSKDKMDFVSSLQSSGKTVIMVGDGENDILALAKADISIGVWHNKRDFGSTKLKSLILAQIERWRHA